MTRLDSPLHDIRIASPCHVPWEQMKGNQRVRFCQDCALHVYNLSAMTAQEAEDLVLKKEGHLCVLFYQREDGTVLTRDCPRGRIAVQRAARRTATVIGMSIVAMFFLICGLLGAFIGVSRLDKGNQQSFPGWFNSGASTSQPPTVMGTPVFKSDKMFPAPQENPAPPPDKRP
jgi:hypothetical protein